MNTSLFLAAQAAQQGGSAMPMILMMVAIFVINVVLYDSSTAKETERNSCFSECIEGWWRSRNRWRYLWNSKHIDLTNNKVDIEIARGVVITVDKGYVFGSVQASQQNQSK